MNKHFDLSSPWLYGHGCDLAGEIHAMSASSGSNTDALWSEVSSNWWDPMIICVSLY